MEQEQIHITINDTKMRVNPHALFAVLVDLLPEAITNPASLDRPDMTEKEAENAQKIKDLRLAFKAAMRTPIIGPAMKNAVGFPGVKDKKDDVILAYLQHILVLFVGLLVELQPQMFADMEQGPDGVLDVRSLGLVVDGETYKTRLG